MVYRETFLQIQPRLLQHLIRRSWIHGVPKYQNTHHRMWWVRTKHQFRIRDASLHRQPKIQSSSVEGDSSKNCGADQHRLQISDLHFDKFPTPATFACWKIRLETEVCTCSQVPTEDMLWIKEVEMVDSVDDLKSSSSVRGIRMPDFEVLDGKIASALNRIIHNSHFNRRVSLEEQKSPDKRTVSFAEGRSLTWSTSTSESLEPMIPSRIMPTCLLLVFEMTIFRNSIRNGMEFYYQSITKTPSDDILDGLYKLRIRESEKLKTVLELHDL